MTGMPKQYHQSHQVLTEHETKEVTLPGLVPGDTPHSNTKATYVSEVESRSKREGPLTLLDKKIASDNQYFNSLRWDEKMIYFKQYHLLREYWAAIISDDKDILDRKKLELEEAIQGAIHFNAAIDKQRLDDFNTYMDEVSKQNLESNLEDLRYQMELLSFIHDVKIIEIEREHIATMINILEQALEDPSLTSDARDDFIFLRDLYNKLDEVHKSSNLHELLNECYDENHNYIPEKGQLYAEQAKILRDKTKQIMSENSKQYQKSMDNIREKSPAYYNKIQAEFDRVRREYNQENAIHKREIQMRTSAIAETKAAPINAAKTISFHAAKLKSSVRDVEVHKLSKSLVELSNDLARTVDSPTKCRETLTEVVGRLDDFQQKNEQRYDHVQSDDVNPLFMAEKLNEKIKKSCLYDENTQETLNNSSSNRELSESLKKIKILQDNVCIEVMAFIECYPDANIDLFIEKVKEFDYSTLSDGSAKEKFIECILNDAELITDEDARDIVVGQINDLSESVEEQNTAGMRIS